MISLILPGIVAAVLLAGIEGTRGAEPAPSGDDLAFFEKKIRPVLSDRCYKCHSADAEKLKGGLLLDTREGIRMGGDSGHAVVPGDLKESLMIKAISWTDKELQMPPKEKLPDEIIADFQKWVKMGAPDPRENKGKVVKHGIDIEKGREHWAFKLPAKSAPPKVKAAAWPKTDIDRYVLAGMEAKGLKPVGDADPHTLVRRLYFDLTGLPPSPEEADAFVQDCQKGKTQAAVEKLADKLMASPQFGEKWGRHWLDVARYGESSGKEVNTLFPHTWRYRNYVIKAVNDDKPYDRFLKEQIAGDLLPHRNDDELAELKIASGYLAIGPKSLNTRDKTQFLLDLADEQIDTITSGLMGMTVACARCHDHKFDPIPTKDYYAMAGIFLSTETCYGTPAMVQNNNPAPLLQLPSGAYLTEPEPMPAALKTSYTRMLDRAKKDQDELLKDPKEKSNPYALAGNLRYIRDGIQITIAEKSLDHFNSDGDARKLAIGVRDRIVARDARVLQRGEVDKPLQSVPRGFLQVVNTEPAPKVEHGSGRRELAEWIASPANPLTARVMANRIWLHLFGRGIVPTPDNFGTTGQPPTNQPLLDYLALRFVDNGWSVKKTIRDIVSSRAYQLDSTYDAKNYAVDPENTHLWRMTKRRLDAEEIHDAMLSVSGKLDLDPLHASLAFYGEGLAQIMNQVNPIMASKESYKRAVYLPIIRDQVPDSLLVFDFAEPSLVVGEREDTTVPSQALYMMNSKTAESLADAFARRVTAKPLSGNDRTKLAYQLAFGRTPTPTELGASEQFFKQFNGSEAGGKQKRELVALTAFCQALFATAEFRYLN